LQASTHVRTGPAQWLSEIVATFGLMLVILGHRRAQGAAWMVAAWIGAAYWFTASTSFANPAITIARSLTDTFSGIRPIDVPAFIMAQWVGALAALETLARTARDKVEAVHIDLADLRGYHYQSGVSFSVFTAGERSAIGRGERYDGIGKAFGRARPATGFTLDLRQLAALVGRAT